MSAENDLAARLRLIVLTHPEPAAGTLPDVVARCVESDRTTVVSELTVYDGDRVLGRGKQVQRILPKRKLYSLIQRYD